MHKASGARLLLNSFFVYEQCTKQPFPVTQLVFLYWRGWSQQVSGFTLPF